jgi:hypothetical protein
MGSGCKIVTWTRKVPSLNLGVASTILNDILVVFLSPPRPMSEQQDKQFCLCFVQHQAVKAYG